MRIEPNYRLPASTKSKWYNGPKGCAYRFHYGDTLTVEWDGGKPPLQAKSFWEKYARKRDAFLASVTPVGKSVMSVCFFTGKVKVIEGKAVEG